jgi:glycosyltransferase involved in cell wall biosynthesis
LADLAAKQEATRVEKEPLVSTVIISYNHAAVLPRSIESAVDQTYRPHEIIIVDDGSRDESLEIAKQYQKENPEIITVLTHPDHLNRGISATCNLGLKHARGKYISWLGSDDIWLPNKIEKQVAELEQNSQVGIVYSKAQCIDQNGDIINGSIGRDFNFRKSHLIQILRDSFIPAPTVLVRSECFELVGNYDEDLVYSDWEMWMRILGHWKLRYLNDVTTLYRVHDNNTSVGIDAETDAARKLAVIQAISRKASAVGGELLADPVQRLLKRKPEEIEKEKAICFLNNYFLSCQKGEPRPALKYLQQAFVASPTRSLQIRRLGAIIKHLGILFLKGGKAARSELQP